MIWGLFLCAGIHFNHEDHYFLNIIECNTSANAPAPLWLRSSHHSCSLRVIPYLTAILSILATGKPVAGGRWGQLPHLPFSESSGGGEGKYLSCFSFSVAWCKLVPSISCSSWSVAGYSQTFPHKLNMDGDLLEELLEEEMVTMTYNRNSRFAWEAPVPVLYWQWCEVVCSWSMGLAPSHLQEHHGIQSRNVWLALGTSVLKKLSK